MKLEDLQRAKVILVDWKASLDEETIVRIIEDSIAKTKLLDRFCTDHALDKNRPRCRCMLCDAARRANS